MKKVILHIGNHKTGSTVIQHTLAVNEHKLREEQIVYTSYHPVTLNHVTLAYALLREALKKFGQLNQYPALEKSNWNVDEILESIFSVPGKIYIISFEGFFAETLRVLHGLALFEKNDNTDVRKQKTIAYKNLEKKCNQYIREQLAKNLHKYAEEIVVACYVRRQDLFLEAMYNEYVKEPWTNVKELPNFTEFVKLNPVHLNYAEELKEWEIYFSKAEMVIRNYEREYMPKGIFYDFMMNAVQIPFEKIEKFDKVEKKDINLRLSRDALETKKILFIKMPDQGIHELFKKYILEHDKEKDYAYFSIIDRIQLMEQFVDTNQYVAKQYLGRSPEPLFLNLDYFVKPYSGLTQDKFDSIMQWITHQLKI